MKKKTLSLFLALVLSLSLLAGCGGGDEPSNQPSDNKEPSTAQQPRAVCCPVVYISCFFYLSGLYKLTKLFGRKLDSFLWAIPVCMAL